MFRFFRRYLRPHWAEILIVLSFAGLQVFIQTFLILKDMKTVIDQGVASGNMDEIVRITVRMAVFSVAAVLCTIVTSYVSARVVSSVVCSARRDCMGKVSEMLPQDFALFGASSLQTRIMSDMFQLQSMLLTLLRGCLLVVFVIGFILILVFMMNTLLGGILLVAFALTVLFLVLMSSRAKPLFVKVQRDVERLNLLVREKLTGARTIRAYRNETLEEERLKNADREFFEENVEAGRRIVFLSPISLLVMNWTIIVLYLIGTQQVKQGISSVSSLILIISYLSYFTASLAIVPILVNMIPRVTVSVARILELLDFVPEGAGSSPAENGNAAADANAAEGKRPSPDRMGRQGCIHGGKIEFQDVIFGYNRAAQVITNLRFTAEAGKTTAVIGATGSGKTAMLNLLQGLYRMNFGDILIDGVSVTQMDPGYLHRSIACAPQKAMVFQDTVRANITCYDDTVSEERIRLALKASCFDEVLEEMPEGLDTVMAQEGMNLSGGQRQRLCLARAFARDVPIYLFDDSLSALDAVTEKKVRGAIDTVLSGKTVLIVSQKISNVRGADKIIVLEKGRVAGEGTHEELLRTCREYREIYHVQCYGEEDGHV